MHDGDDFLEEQAPEKVLRIWLIVDKDCVKCHFNNFERCLFCKQEKIKEINIFEYLLSMTLNYQLIEN